MTDRRVARSALPAVVAAAVRGGVDWVQVREKDLDAAQLLALVRQITESGRALNARLRVLVNRRVDVALAASTGGAHLGFDALSLPEARALLGSRALIGVSAHSAEEVAAAAHAGADYAHLAPIFAPYSKPASREPLGLGVLREAARSSIPVLAQGGIDAQRAGACIAAGAAGVAVTGELCGAADPERAAQGLRAALDSAARLS